MIKCFNAKMCGLAVLMTVIAGCDVKIHYDSETRKLADDPIQLAVQFSSAESDVEALTVELDESKISRDAMAKALEGTTGYFARSEAMSKLERANGTVEFTARRLTHAKEWYAKVKAMKDARQSDSIRQGTSETVSEVEKI